ncbi:MAG: hypothetical protein SF187_24875 [Deltaproteobacteria bacterium]|nr:hypothetical protein [Deltaproteobacteria bacterium]
MKALLRLSMACVTLMACGHAQIKRTTAAPPDDELLKALQARQNATQSLNLETRTTSWLGGDRVRATVLMLVNRQGKLRFEAEVSLKGSVAALTTDGRAFALLDMERNEFKQGPACPQNVASLVRIPLAPDEIAAILLGDAPVGADAKLVAHDWDGDVGAERLVFATNDGQGHTKQTRVLMRKQAKGWVVIGTEGLASNSRGKQGWWRVRYEEHHWTGAVAFPDVIRFAEPFASFDDGVEIKVKDRRVNPEIPEESFHLSPPPDALVRDVNCGEP